ncbi:MAG: hypothetical protein ABJA66_06140 [Actinomycetota bacterium]
MTEIDKTAEIALKTLQNLSEEDFAKDYAEAHYGEIVTTEWMVVHLLTHFDYHLGQINYHRRFFQKGDE